MLQYVITKKSKVDSVQRTASRSDPAAIIDWLAAAGLLDLTPDIGRVHVPHTEIAPYDSTGPSTSGLCNVVLFETRPTGDSADRTAFSESTIATRIQPFTSLFDALTRTRGLRIAACSRRSAMHSRTRVLILAFACSAGLAPTQLRAQQPAQSLAHEAHRDPTRTSMRHVDFYVDSQVVLHIRHLDGATRSKEGGPILFDDKRSFVITIDTAEVGMTADDLTSLLNKFVFGYKGSPLSHLHVHTERDRILLTGRIHKVITFSFEITAAIDVTPDGLLRLHPTKTKFLGLNGEKLMKALGLSLDKLLDLKGATGATVQGNDIFLDPVKILPPPTIEGHVVSVRVEGDQVVQLFGDNVSHSRPHALVPPDTNAPSYMYFKGGTLRFGKLLMLDAEMQIVSLDKSQLFKFDLARYNAQLVAGYERTLADGGLEVWMRDVDRLESSGTLEARPALPAR